jgi:transaldolase
MNPLLQLSAHGQSYWLDNLTRDALESGELLRRVRDEGLRGVTSNPKTFHDSFLNSARYDDQLHAAVAEGRSNAEIYELLMVSDVQRACDTLRPVYDATRGLDGYVSLEVSPYLAHDSEGSIAEGERLARSVERPNLMIKIPGTKAGVSAVERLLVRGIHVNITLLFSVERYLEFAGAYARALEERQRAGKSVADVHSVASFFLSRIDVLVDKRLNELARDERRSPTEPKPTELLGKTAIANAKLAYQAYQASIADERWLRLARAGASPQRLLWASTGTKNRAYCDVMYVEPLIGKDTISTMPEETIAAFADHGVVADTLEQGVPEARNVMAALERLQLDFGAIAEQLENEGIQKFIEPFDEVQKTLNERRSKFRAQSAE